MSFLDFIKIFTDKDISAFNDFKLRIGAELSPLMILLIVLSFALFIYLAMKSTKELKSKNKRMMLIVFRSIALFFILLIVFQPKLELRETKKIKKKMAVLFDDSLSMTLKAKKKKLSRYDGLKKFIAKNEDYFDDLKDDFDLDYFTFGSVLKKTTLKEYLSKSTAEQPRTQIGESIESLRTVNPELEYQDVLLFTDGSDNGKIMSIAGEMDTDLDRDLFQKYLKSLNMNIHPIACEGDDEEFSDLSVKKVVADEFGFIRTPFEINIHIFVNGVDDQNIPVTLKEGDNIIKTKFLMIKKDKKEYKLNMKFYPQKIGRKIYTISLPKYANELIMSNNEQSFFVNIIRDKTRVLYVIGTPTWDERFLRRTLKNNPNIDLITFMILRTSYDYLKVPEIEMSLIPFPTREIFEKELHTFDVVIFLNFNYGPYVNPVYLRNIRDYVIKDGGGFVMVGGDRSFLAGRYDMTPIKEILPIEFSRGMKLYKYGKFKPVLTEVGNVHPILRVDYDEEKNKDAYEALPALEGINSVLKLKDHATALMNHPKERNEHGPAPVIAITDIGKGRTMAITTDTLWKWNFPYIGEGGSTRIYDNFWHNALKWLVKDPDLDLVKLTISDTNFLVGEAVDIKLKVLNHKYMPTDKAKISSQIKSSDNKIIKLQFMRTDIPGEYKSKFIPEKEGNYVIQASAYVNEKYLGKDIHPMIVEDPRDEYIDLEVNYKLLEEIAKVSETEVLTLKDGKLKGDLNAEADNEEQLLGKIELTFWDSKTNFFLISFFLILEWYIRRKYGLY